jgi:DNA-binding NarL/FixJ family response regulator
VQVYSNTIRDLYALAEYATPEQFLTQAIALLKTWIRFDGVLFGTGEARLVKKEVTELNSNHQEIEDQLGQQAQQAQQAQQDQQEHREPIPHSVLFGKNSPIKFNEDLLVRGYRDAPHSPMRGGIRQIYRKSSKKKNSNDQTTSPKTHRSTNPLSLIQELNLCHVIVIGDDASKIKPARWMVLYRRHDVRFSQTDAAHLHGLWTHLSRALVLNRTRHHQRKSLEQDKDAAASGLISMEGHIQIADARFYELLDHEWPILSPQTLPEIAMEVLRAGKVFRGEKIEITLMQRNGFNRCRIIPIKNLEVLSPREFVIARRFSNGMSHKQIARELGISHHTVRNQLAHTYRKLNVHDKVSLFDFLRTNGLNK